MYNSAIAVLKGIKSDWIGLMNTMPNGSFDKLIDRVKSDSDKEDYIVMESMPAIKEWLDNRHIADFTDELLEVRNLDWDDGVRVKRNTLSDSKKYLGGNIEKQIKRIADLYKGFPDRLCQALLDANSAAFDGTAFFATTRPNIDTGSNTINNLLTGTSSTTYSFAEFETDYIAAKTALLGFRDKHNQAFNKGAKLGVLVPQHLSDLANQLLGERADRVYDGTAEKSNVYAGSAEVIINWEQSTTTDNDWYLVNLSAIDKPFLIQDREPPKWKLFDFDDYKKYYEYAMDFRMGYSFLNPFSMVKTNN